VHDGGQRMSGGHRRQDARQRLPVADVGGVDRDVRAQTGEFGPQFGGAGRLLAPPADQQQVAGTVLDDQTASNLTLGSQQVLNKVLTPKVPAGSPVQVYFVELQLKQNGPVSWHGCGAENIPRKWMPPFSC